MLTQSFNREEVHKNKVNRGSSQRAQKQLSSPYPKKNQSRKKTLANLSRLNINERPRGGEKLFMMMRKLSINYQEKKVGKKSNICRPAFAHRAKLRLVEEKSQNRFMPHAHCCGFN